MHRHCNAPPRPSARAWLAWSLGSAFFFYVFVLRVSPSIMVGDLMRDFGVGAAVLGNLSAFYFYAYAALQIPVGVLMDHFGPRRLLTGSTLVCALGCVLFAMSPGIEIAYAGRFLIGAGAAFGWVGTLTIIALYFPHNRFASLSAGTQLLGMLGGVVGQAPLERVVQLTGWRWTLWAFALVAALGAVLLWAVVRDRVHSPEPGVRLLSGLRAAAANRQTWLNALVGFTFAGPMLSFAGLWGVPFLSTAYQLDRGAAASLTSLFFIGWGVGGLMLGYLSDRTGRRRPFAVAGGLLLGATFTSAVYLDGLPVPVLGALFLLAGCGGSTAVLSFARAREHNPPYAGGAAMGMVNTAMMGSAVVLQPLIGVLLDLNWDGAMQGGAPVYSTQDYRAAFMIMPLGCLLGVAAAALAREHPLPARTG